MSEERVVSLVVSVVATNPDTSPGRPESTVWKVGSPVPGSREAVVHRMFLDEEVGEVEVFAAPVQGSELQQSGHCLHFRIMPQGVKLVCSVVSAEDWQKWMIDTENASKDDEGEEPSTASSFFPQDILKQ